MSPFPSATSIPLPDRAHQPRTPSLGSHGLKALTFSLVLLGPALTARAANLTSTNVVNDSAGWNAAQIWKTNGAGPGVTGPVPGNTYQCVFNGVFFGNNTGNTRLRNLYSAGSPLLQTFPGDSLTLNANTEFRFKRIDQNNVPTVHFPGVGGNPGLILDGGILNVGDDAIIPLTGAIRIASQSYICPGDVGGGAVKPLRGLNVAAQLSGTGTLVIFQAGTTVAQQISGSSNTFTGRWMVKAGWLLASGLNSLGTNSVTVDPGNVLPLEGKILNVAGPAWFEPAYDLNSAGRLVLTNGGLMVLHQNCLFSSALIEGKALTAGTHTYEELAAAYPNNFALGGSGSITIQPYGPPPVLPPAITRQPVSIELNAGSPAQLSAAASGADLAYRWQKGTNTAFSNLVDGGNVSGATTDTLTFAALAAADSADYRLVASNTAGSATSQVATVTVIVPDSTRPRVASLNPPAASAVNSLTQLHITFNEPVLNLEAADLLVNGQPATGLSGSGADYTFTFTQPLPGLVSVYWDIDNGVIDAAGNPLDVSAPWSYTLNDTTAPALASVSPADGSTVISLVQARVLFTEPVVGLTAADLLVNGVPATGLAGAGFGPYLFSFPAPAKGPVNFTWAPTHQIRDAASNRFANPGWSVALDSAVASSAATNVVINEFLAANISTNGLADEDGTQQDWIELYNRGSAALNLCGWSLTDDPASPAKWTFPATTLDAGQFLVLFASGKDRRNPGANLHTNFKLNADGDYLALFNADWPPLAVHAYTPGYPEQRNDVSFGLDVAGAPRYFTPPTPGEPNGVSSITGVVAQVHFSVKHGFFDRPFNLLLDTVTPGATILYTTDGSPPALAESQTNGAPFSGPITIDRTAVVRAAAFAPGQLPSRSESRTYLFPEDIVRQPNDPAGYPTGYVWTPNPGTVQTGSRAYYQMDPAIVNHPQYTNSVRAGLLSIPTMSLVLPIPDLFDPLTGIYTHPESRGLDWERACSMELLFPDGSAGPQIDCGLQIQGGTQRDPNKNAKHSFRVSFKGDYGAGRLEFPVFPDSTLLSYNTLVLDGGINMWWHYVGGSTPADQRFRAQCVRDQYTSDLLQALGQPVCHGRFYHIYLNGLYWGLHYLHERPDAAFCASYLGGDESEYDVLRTTSAGLEIVAGNADAWNSALALANVGLTNDAQYLELQQWVDIDNLIDYMIVNHWVANEDWPQHNWYVLRRRAPGEGFKFIVWDAEHVLKTTAANRTTADAAGSPARIYNALRNNPEFRLRFADHLQQHFTAGGLFYTDPNRPVWDPAHPERNVPASFYLKRINEIDTAIVDESARWGGYLLTTNYTRNEHWLRELNNLLGFINNAGNTANFFPTRSATVLGQYHAIGLYPEVLAPVFSQAGGNIPPGLALSMTNLNAGGTIFYTTNGTDPRLYGSGAVSLDARAFNAAAPVRLAGCTRLLARVLFNGAWSPLTRADFTASAPGIPLRITELMYRPVGGDAFEFIELQNIGPNTVDLTGCAFNGISFVFPDGSSLAPGALLVLASAADPAAFAARYPGVAVAGYFGGSLSNNGERIELLDRFGHTIISVDYSNSGGWPAAADGLGYSLEIIQPNGDPDDPANWRASSTLNGSPGLLNPPATTPAVQLNEIMADNAGAVTNGGTWPDWIELRNSGSSAVSLADWSLSNSGNPSKFVFPPDTTLPGEGYLVVWCDSDTKAPGLHSGFKLGRKGETIFLYDSATNRVDAVGFGLQVTDYTLGRIGADNAWGLALPTPGSNNVAAVTASATNLVINEWLANSAPGSSDWLELFNRSSASPVPLSGLCFTTSNNVFQVRSLSFIPPGGFVQLFADAAPGPDHLDFTLAAAGDALALLDASGQPIDSVSFAAQPENVSQGRWPDGTANIVNFPGTASPAASNYLLSYAGPVLNELMARNRSAVYDPHGNNPDWIELYNPSESTVSLAGMGLGTDPANPMQWVFPSDATIASNSYLVVWFDPSRPPSTNSTPDLNTGFALDGDGTTVFLWNTNTQIVDSVAFGFQVTDRSLGRSFGGWTLLETPSPGGPNGLPAALGNPANLRLNEWMADPASGNDWLELYSADPLPVSLGGLYLTDDPSITGLTNYQIPALSFIAPRGWVKIVADSRPGQGPNHAAFSLDKLGQTVRLYDGDLQAIDGVDYGLQARGVSQGRLPDAADHIVPFPLTPTPDTSNYLPLENIFINEVLTHTDPPLEDAIELYNAGATDVPLSGWFLSNAESDLRKFRIPDPALLLAHGYRVFYEYQFNSTNPIPFTLNSAHGDSVFLSEANAAGELTGYRAQVSFGAAENGVSWGRVPTSTGVDFVPLAARTLGNDNPSDLTEFRAGSGLTNAPARVGPVVINELMYRPVTWVGTNATENPNDAFVELLNITAAPVALHDPSAPTNTWRLGGGISFSFPTGTVLGASALALVVPFAPANDPAALAAFQSTYALPAGTLVFGPYAGKLGHTGDTVSLYQPDPPQTAPHPDAGFVPSILVDRLTYSALAPWPDAANGTGFSLQRRRGPLYANEPLNWLACAPTPGATNCGIDTDNDGLPDDWEIAHQLDPLSAIGDNGAQGDPDHDGFTNLQEFQGGTDPRDPGSFLSLAIAPAAEGVSLRFQAVATHSYTVQFRDSLVDGAWSSLFQIDPLPTNTLFSLPDTAVSNQTRFYRLLTPRLP